MKIFRIINKKVIAVFLVSMVTLIGVSTFLSSVKKEDLKNALASVYLVDNSKEDSQVLDLVTDVTKESVLTRRVIVYDGMTMNELADKLNRSMKSNLTGKGLVLASYTIEKGVDPYLALGIMLLETGCNWKCSSLMTKCNNVGGMKGSPGCDGGSYKSFPTLDDGIRAFVDNLARNYYAYGLTTPEAMNKKYAESTAWATKVRNYMASIQSK